MRSANQIKYQIAKYKINSQIEKTEKKFKATSDLLVGSVKVREFSPKDRETTNYPLTDLARKAVDGFTESFNNERSDMKKRRLCRGNC